MTESPSPLTMLLSRHTRRREFLALLGGAAAAALNPCARAQEAGRTYRLGIVGLTPTSIQATREITLPELARQGFMEGRNLLVDVVIGAGDELLGLTRELVARKPDVIFAISQAPVRIISQITANVPIVMFGDDPVRSGFAESLARPGGNITGVTTLSAQLDAKRLQLLHEGVPSARRIATLFFIGTPNREQRQASEQAIREVAKDTGVEIIALDVTDPADYGKAFESMRKLGAEALVITANPQLYRDGARLAGLALEVCLPTICEWAEMARTGCVIGYGPDLPEMRRRAGAYIARVLQGTPPSALPIEGPTHFQFAVNLKSARAVGIEIPQGLLLRADEVIE
jgi:putative ABC transport system substrate-binding protein